MTARTDDRQSWQQLWITLSGHQVSAASELLEALGALSVTTHRAEGDDHFDLAEPVYHIWEQTRVGGLFDGSSELKPVVDSIVRIFEDATDDLSIERFDDQDWERSWLERFQPIEVGKNLWICPSWRTPPAPRATNLVLDPGLAFGTGTHATTALCLDYLSRHKPVDSVVVDYGSGSGILAIAGLLLGARFAVANDIDPLALVATRANAERNGVSGSLVTCSPEQTADYLPDESAGADLVIANILAEALIELNQPIGSLIKPGGALLLSGILSHQADQVRSAYPQFRFQTYIRDEWCLLASHG